MKACRNHSHDKDQQASARPLPVPMAAYGPPPGLVAPGMQPTLPFVWSTYGVAPHAHHGPVASAIAGQTAPHVAVGGQGDALTGPSPRPVLARSHSGAGGGGLKQLVDAATLTDPIHPYAQMAMAPHDAQWVGIKTEKGQVVDQPPAAAAAAGASDVKIEVKVKIEEEDGYAYGQEGEEEEDEEVVGEDGEGEAGEGNGEIQGYGGGAGSVDDDSVEEFGVEDLAQEGADDGHVEGGTDPVKLGRDPQLHLHYIDAQGHKAKPRRSNNPPPGRVHERLFRLLSYYMNGRHPEYWVHRLGDGQDRLFPFKCRGDSKLQVPSPPSPGTVWLHVDDTMWRHGRPQAVWGGQQGSPDIHVDVTAFFGKLFFGSTESAVFSFPFGHSESVSEVTTNHLNHHLDRIKAGLEQLSTQILTPCFMWFVAEPDVAQELPDAEKPHRLLANIHHSASSSSSASASAAELPPASSVAHIVSVFETFFATEVLQQQPPPSESQDGRKLDRKLLTGLHQTRKRNKATALRRKRQKQQAGGGGGGGHHGQRQVRARTDGRTATEWIEEREGGGTEFE
ncbi:unnamed protein product [Vitrella brassicaformis CCMP3155]|uniref:Uncharacterized protein n=2 Tax=Vitrella brassicaformis TaxID=1169539 RepID=A0A0G4H7N2_VITBC|nr:unnamed protein product [Vitrella brassicaformis CCMP3155]|eukprot:CEM39873.1 unnamed protein product [Vitrella brassicaformis CCMP3155]